MNHLKISAHDNSHKRQCRLTVETLHSELRRRGEKYKQRQKDAGEQSDGELALQERPLYITERFHLESVTEQRMHLCQSQYCYCSISNSRAKFRF
jgi:hypothetical protein